MKKTQDWIPSTNPNLLIHGEWDTDDPEETRVVHYVGYKVLPDGEEVTDPILVAKVCNEAVAVEVHVNGTLKPAILEVLPLSEKIPVIENEELIGYRFKHEPDFLLVDGKITMKADQMSIDARDKAFAVLSQHEFPKK